MYPRCALSAARRCFRSMRIFAVRYVAGAIHVAFDAFRVVVIPHAYVVRMSRTTNRRWTRTRRARDPDGYAEWLAGAQRRTRDRTLDKRYGIDADTFDALLAGQGGVCDMCGDVPPAGPRGLTAFHVDHDHDSGSVRAILCASCNWFLEYFERGWAEKAERYLSSHPTVPRSRIEALIARRGTLPTAPTLRPAADESPLRFAHRRDHDQLSLFRAA